MDPVLGRAMKRKSELRAELRDIERFLELYQEFKAPPDPRQAVLDVAEPSSDSGEQRESNRGIPSPILSTTEAPPAGDEAPGLSRAELRPHIRATILEAGRPLTRGQLLHELDTKNIRVGGKADRSKNMGTILWRLRDEFVNLEGFGYWPRDLRNEEANYDPEDQNSPEAIDYTLRRTQPKDVD